LCSCIVANCQTQRKDFYRQKSENYSRPWLFLLTDGEPTDDVSGAIRMLQENYDANGVTFFSVGVGDKVRFDVLRDICPKKRDGSPEREPIKLDDTKFSEMFEWLSNSLKRASAQRAGDTQLEDPYEGERNAGGWGMAPK
jgi:uncharacterized protein YegL